MKRTIKQRRWLHQRVRICIQLIFFLLFPAAFHSAFSGIKYIFTQLEAGKPIELNSFVLELIFLCMFTLLFGRFFCGYACAFGAFGDALHGIFQAICRQMGFKYKGAGKHSNPLTRRIQGGMRYLKYLVLLLIALLCFAGVYRELSSLSPWEEFSLLRNLNFDLTGHLPGLIFLLLILVGMAVCERFFCRFLCPLGAVFSLLPILPFFSLKRNRSECLPKCSACERICPCQVKLSDRGRWEVNGECIQCQKCVPVCPKNNIMKHEDIWFTLLRAAILIGIMIYLER